MADTDTKFVCACLNAVAPTLGDEEAVMAIEKGQTRYSRQTFLYYRVQIATFVGKTGNSPVDQRSLGVAVNVDTPDTAGIVPLGEWVPFS